MATNNQIRIATDSETKQFAYEERGQNIKINAANLQIELGYFKKAIRNTLSLPIIIALVAIWLPFITADFKPLFGQTAESIRLAYLIVAVILTGIIIYPIFITIFVILAKLIPPIQQVFPEFYFRYETDEEKKTKAIIKRCREDNGA